MTKPLSPFENRGFVDSLNTRQICRVFCVKRLFLVFAFSLAVLGPGRPAAGNSADGGDEPVPHVPEVVLDGYAADQRAEADQENCTQNKGADTRQDGFRTFAHIESLSFH